MKFVPLIGSSNRERASAAVCQLAVACAALWGAAAHAQATPAPDALPQATEADLAIEGRPATQWTGVWVRDNLLGDMGGLRPWLGKYGVTFNLSETSEYLANLRGGLKTGGAYDGLTTFSLGVDTQKAFGLPGGTFNVSGLNIHGRDLSADYLDTWNTASGIEAQATTRLWELWYQQAFLDGRLDVKLGQQAIDQEFMFSEYAGTFINTMFGWPGVPSYDMPNGGPAYPLAGLGVRVRGQITPQLTGLFGVFAGDPLGNRPNDISGTNFNLHNGALVIGELQYALNQPGDGQMETGVSKGLPGTYRIGFWYNDEHFADQGIDNSGLSLANPLSTGVPQSRHGNYSVYAVADQMVWTPDPTGPKSLGVFARVMAAPGDRNAISFSANAGVVLKAPFEGRDDDSFGLGLAYVQVGNHLTNFDRNYVAYNDDPYAVRKRETVVEATYQYQVAPWWTLQGDLQYAFSGGAGQDAAPVRNTLVVGVRTNITF